MMRNNRNGSEQIRKREAGCLDTGGLNPYHGVVNESRKNIRDNIETLCVKTTA